MIYLDRILLDKYVKKIKITHISITLSSISLPGNLSVANYSKTVIDTDCDMDIWYFQQTDHHTRIALSGDLECQNSAKQDLSVSSTDGSVCNNIGTKQAVWKEILSCIIISVFWMMVGVSFTHTFISILKFLKLIL